jgi:hypothetical protein
VTGLDTESKFDAHINIASHLDDLGELDGLFGGALEVFDTEDFEVGVVKLSIYQ